jgi:hypothetical protein
MMSEHTRLVRAMRLPRPRSASPSSCLCSGNVICGVDHRRRHRDGAARLRARLTSHTPLHWARSGREDVWRGRRAAGDALTPNGRVQLPPATPLITGTGSRRITPQGELTPLGRRRASTRHATEGAINEGGGASRLSTSKNFRHTIRSSDATACTRSRYRFTSRNPGGRRPCTCG